MALVSGNGETCEWHGYHFIPPGDTLTVDLNGAALICDTLLTVLRRELRRRRWVRVIRQAKSPEPYEYLKVV